ncbi:MAG: sigma-54-dependent Fis family transcriptional regulator [bacterium]|nr:sigma-54-dependent Fis family transcriptional regulator [bacterium]
MGPEWASISPIASLRAATAGRSACTSAIRTGPARCCSSRTAEPRTETQTVADADILIVEDETAQRVLLAAILRGAGYRVSEAGSAEDALTRLRSTPVNLVLSDWKLPGMDGMGLFERVRERWPDTAFVIVTAYGTIARAVEAVRAGADDYLTKPFERQALLLAVERSLHARALVDENRRLVEELGERDRLVDLVGRAPRMQSLYREMDKVAGTDATVLIRGESGTGKELAARALHSLSPRRDAPFVAVNCAAIPEGLIESEFFGAVRGAYSGADRDRTGRFESAHTGTLFLDEVGELPVALQPKLLRALQERCVTPVGGVDEVPVDVRIVAATNRDLEEEVAAGAFREDLYYRLNVVPMHVPALRDRREDVPILIEHFVRSATRRHDRPRPRFSSAVTRRLLDHPWPGNVRELANVIERLVLLAEEARPVDVEDLPTGFDQAPTGAGRYRLDPAGMSWDEHERDLLRQALELARGNRTRAAKLLGMPYKAFLYRLEKHGLKQPA